MMSTLFQDPSFWVLVSSIIFIAAIWRPAGQIIGRALDNKITRIRQDLEEARALKEEAQSLLAQYQRSQRDAMHEADEIKAHAISEAEILRKEMLAKFETATQRREKQAIEKIAQAEAKAADEIKQEALALALKAAAEMMADQLSGKDQDRLVTEALDGIKKSKAA